VSPAKLTSERSWSVYVGVLRDQQLQSEGAAFGLSLANNGNVIVEFKSPYDDGTTGTRCHMWY
jgi:hypothetical protein